MNYKIYIYFLPFFCFLFYCVVCVIFLCSVYLQYNIQEIIVKFNVVSSKNFKILGLTYKSNHFEWIFCIWCYIAVQFHSFVCVSSFPVTICWKDCFLPHWMVLNSLSEIIRLYICVCCWIFYSVSLVFMPVHCPTMVLL